MLDKNSNINLNILFIIPQLSKGGAERVVNNLSNYLINFNNVSVISFVKKEPEYYFDNRINLKYLDNSISDNFFAKITNRTCRLYKNIKSIKPDIIVCFLPKAAFLTLFLRRFNLIKKSKIIVSVRNDPKIEYKSLINRLLMKYLYPLADGFVFQTNDAKNYFSNKIQEKSTIIMNSINPSFLCEPFCGKREKIIVSVGRLEKQKNYEFLINSFFKIHSLCSEFKLIIYGEGKERKNLEDLIEKLNLKNDVYLPGNVNDIKEKIYNAYIFALTSIYEGMPNSLLEAMSLGIPCVAFDCPCGGPKEIINDKNNGFLINTNDENSFIQLILDIINEKYDLNIISQNASKIKERLNPDIVNNKWYDYFKYIINLEE